MTAIRRALVLVAPLAGIAAALYLWFAPDMPVAVPPASATALPAALPAPAPATAASPASTALAPAALPMATPAVAPPRVGSEGYGPHIDRAQAGADAGAAWEAVRWLRSCASTEGRRNSFEALRNQGVSPEMMTQLMVEADAEARRCQTVTAAHRALLPELAARAMRAGVTEAASAYAGAVFPADLTPAQRQEVADAMRRDARSGDPMSLLGAVVSNEAWGLSDDERLAFMVAYGEQPGAAERLHAQTVLMNLAKQGGIRFKAAPTAEQQAAARQAAQAILDQARARGGS